MSGFELNPEDDRLTAEREAERYTVDLAATALQDCLDRLGIGAQVGVERRFRRVTLALKPGQVLTLIEATRRPAETR